MKSKEKNEAAQFVITLLLLKAVGGTGLRAGSYHATHHAESFSGYLLRVPTGITRDIALHDTLSSYSGTFRRVPDLSQLHGDCCVHTTRPGNTHHLSDLCARNLFSTYPYDVYYIVCDCDYELFIRIEFFFIFEII